MFFRYPNSKDVGKLISCTLMKIPEKSINYAISRFPPASFFFSYLSTWWSPSFSPNRAICDGPRRIKKIRLRNQEWKCLRQVSNQFGWTRIISPIPMNKPPLVSDAEKQGGGLFIMPQIPKIFPSGGSKKHRKTSFSDVSEQIRATKFFGLRPRFLLRNKGGVYS